MAQNTEQLDPARNLPPGFVLDAPQDPSANLPPGFVLDRPQPRHGDPSGAATVQRSTMGTRAREMALGAVEGLGLDPAKPVSSALSGLWNLGKSILTGGENIEIDPVTLKATGDDPIISPIVAASKQQLAESQRRFDQGDLAGATVYAYAGLVPLIGPTATRIGDGIREGMETGDYDKMANNVGQAISFIGALETGTKGGRAATAGAIEKTGGAVVQAAETTAARAGQIAEKGKQFITGKGGDPTNLLTRALKPKSTNIRFEADMNRAIPEIKLTEAELGRPIGGLDDLVEAIPLAKKRVRAQYDDIAGPQRMRQIDGTPIAEAIEASVSRKLKFTNPKKAAAIVEEADKYRRSFAVEELEDFLKTTNAELDAYYGKYPAASRVARTANPDTAVTVAEGKALRDVIYGALNEGTQPGIPRELNRRYGALLNLEKETFRRRNVALRQQAESLTEQLGKVAAAFEVGKAALEAPIRPFHAAQRLVGAYAGRKVATIIKERNTADAYIQRALENYTRRPGGVPPSSSKPPTPRKPLPPGPTTTQSGGVAPSRSTSVTVSHAPPVETANLYKQIVNDSVEARLKNILAEQRSGATEMTGRARMEVDPNNPHNVAEITARHGGGFKVAFPELGRLPDAPSRIAAAIEKGSGVLYEEVKKAVKRFIEDSEGEAILSFLEDTP